MRAYRSQASQNLWGKHASCDALCHSRVTTGTIASGWTDWQEPRWRAARVAEQARCPGNAQLLLLWKCIGEGGLLACEYDVHARPLVWWLVLALFIGLGHQPVDVAGMGVGPNLKRLGHEISRQFMTFHPPR